MGCYFREHPLHIRKMSLDRCVSCGRYAVREKWVKLDGSWLKSLVSKNIVVPEHARLGGVEVGFTEGDKSLKLDVLVDGRYREAGFSDSIEGLIKVNKVTCSECGRLTRGYYVAVLQLRDSALKFDLDSSKVSNVVEVHGGADFYLTSLDYLKQLEARFRNLGYVTLRTSKLVGKKEGRDVYRVYLSAKPPEFEAGDFIEAGGKKYRVLKVEGNVKCYDLDSRKTKILPPKNLVGGRIIGKSSDVRKAMVSEVARDRMQLMDLTDYQTHRIPKVEGLSVGKEVEYVNVKGKVYLL